MQKINWRVVFFAILLLSIVGTPAYVYLRAATSGGISRRGDLVEVDIYAMSNFQFDQIDGVTADVPKRYRELDGKRVLLCGEMWAPQSAAGQVDSFDLVYSIGKCCIGTAPKIQHFIKSKVQNGRSVDYHTGQVNVVGILHVNVERADGRVQSVYRLDVERVDQVALAPSPGTPGEGWGEGFLRKLFVLALAQIPHCAHLF